MARRLYAALAAGSKRRKADDAKLQPTRGQFYITVPNRDYPGVQLAPHGGFTQEYKYGFVTPVEDATRQDMMLGSTLLCFCPGILALVLAVVLWLVVVRRK